MKFKVDENLPVDVVDLLRSSSDDASSVFDENLIGESDDRISEVCQEEERVLITLDLDFSDVRTYPPDNYPGLIVLRLHQQDKPYVISVIKK